LRAGCTGLQPGYSQLAGSILRGIPKKKAAMPAFPLDAQRRSRTSSRERRCTGERELRSLVYSTRRSSRRSRDTLDRAALPVEDWERGTVERVSAAPRLTWLPTGEVRLSDQEPRGRLRLHIGCSTIRCRRVRTAQPFRVEDPGRLHRQTYTTAVSSLSTRQERAIPSRTGLATLYVREVAALPYLGTREEDVSAAPRRAALCRGEAETEKVG